MYVTEMTASEARADWAQVLRKARSGEPVTVTQHGEPVAVVVDIVWWRQARAAMKMTVEVAAYDHAKSRGTADTSTWESVRAELKVEVTAEVLAEVRRELGLTGGTDDRR